jgi:signal transduction histidine kinase
LGDGVKLKPSFRKNRFVIWADPGQMRQILYNLAINQSSVADSGTVKIKVFDMGGEIVMEVEDDGEDT